MTKHSYKKIAAQTHKCLILFQLEEDEVISRNVVYINSADRINAFCGIVPLHQGQFSRFSVNYSTAMKTYTYKIHTYTCSK